MKATFYIHCARGHHICAYCIQFLTKCPICNDVLLPRAIKHLVADDLTSKLNEIQLSIDEDIKSSNTKSQQDQSVQTDLLITKPLVVQTDETNHLIAAKLSVYTQTYNDNFQKPNNNYLKKQIINEAHSYQCLICWCKFVNGSYEQLEEHLKQCHKHIVQEEHELSDVRMKEFDVQCNNLPWECDHALIIDNKAVIFVDFIVRSSGCFKCSVRCIKVERLMPILNYTITVPTDPRLKYTGKVRKVVEVKPYKAQDNLEDFDICFNPESMSSILKEKSFTFTFSIN